MSASLDLSRWRGTPHGINYRRWTIVSYGLRQLFRLRFFKILLALAWVSGFLIALLGLAFAQSVTDGGWLETLARQISPRAEATVSAMGAIVLLYPDICIGGFYSVVFWLHSYVGLWVSLFAMTALLPRLITRDRATNALIVYLSRPITSADYLLGKLGIILGVLLCMWSGPLLFGWLLSVAFAPNTDFIIHSFGPLLDALLFHTIGVVTLAAIALGVSAISRTSRNTLMLWVGLWVILGVVTSVISGRNRSDSPVWIQRASFTHNLNEVRAGILRPDQALITAGEELPITNRDFAANLKRVGARSTSSDFDGALYSLAGFVVLSSFVFLRRMRPE
ncbi:MAG: ABC transporter permease subunit [Verrucomicrobiota bacterium]